MTLHLRPRSPDDLPELVTVLRAVHERMGYPSVWPDNPAAFVQGRGEAWVAEQDGQLVGQVMLAPLPEPRPDWVREAQVPLEVKRLFVSPDAQRGGTARALLAHALSEARRRGAFSVLQVNESSVPALRLYEREGWRFVARTRAPWTDPDGSHPWVRVYAQPSS
ncbi:GNAT family N-acetyltransferase [Deinococcus sedimenti]|uniref:GNAT family N-acetyltransferase n=1 Tax=Deinococcus sedimenti TaxID=1867090 RepID=A0ABQ2RX84_9DEIO|nr:GNAT family N-acetyltransferase [Deinococcus sedimenti]GGR77645.1 GNAT family N-acetyltransferase [Deinococcus sedimenti]